MAEILKDLAWILCTDNLVKEHQDCEIYFQQMGFSVKDLIMISAYAVAESMNSCSVRMEYYLEQLISQEMDSYPGTDKEDLQWLLDISGVICTDLMTQMQDISILNFTNFMADTWVGNDLIVTLQVPRRITWGEGI